MTRNDVFVNVKIGETFYWGGHSCTKLNKHEALVYNSLDDTEKVYYVADNINVTAG